MAKVTIDCERGDAVTVNNGEGMGGYVLLRVHTREGRAAEVAMRRDQAEQVISALTVETKRLER